MVVKLGEDNARRSFGWGKSPERDEDGKKATKVNDQHQSFNQRQLLCEENVERYGKGSD